MPLRDVLERPIDATLDVNGWDLRKALELMLRSNEVPIEWLTSPVRGVGTGRMSFLRALSREPDGPLANVARPTTTW